jgi:hypothetical protein
VRSAVCGMAISVALGACVFDAGAAPAPATGQQQAAVWMGPLGTDPDTGGLGISPKHFMRKASSQGGATRYVPGQDCVWSRPGGAQEPEPAAK